MFNKYQCQNIFIIFPGIPDVIRQFLDQNDPVSANPVRGHIGVDIGRMDVKGIKGKAGIRHLDRQHAAFKKAFDPGTAGGVFIGITEDIDQRLFEAELDVLQSTTGKTPLRGK